MLLCNLDYEDGRHESGSFILPLSIGRAASCGLRLNSWRVARQHAAIQAGAEGIYIEDFGSLAGTLVNGRRVARYGPLLPGHEIIIGPCRLLIQQVSGAKVPAVDHALAGRASVKKDSPRIDKRIVSPGSSPGLQTGPKNPARGSSNVPLAACSNTSFISSDNDFSIDLHASESTRLRAYGVEDAKPPLASVEQPPKARAKEGQTAFLTPEDRVSEGGLRCGPDEVMQRARGSGHHVQHRRRLHRALLEALDLRRRDIATLSDQALRAEASELLRRIIEADRALDPQTDRRLLLEEVVNEAVGLGPLEPLLADPSITEIMVNRFDEIFVETGGLLRRHASVFSSEQAVQAVIERIVSPLGRRIDESSPMVDARLPDGSRVNAVIPPVALRGASLTIRKFPVKRPVMDDLLRLGALSPAMQAFLRACVSDRKNIVVSGGTGSGKTTLLNILSNCIPPGERIVTIEDAAELRLDHEHLVTLEARPANLEGRGRIDIRDLVRNALRMRPDRIVIGECRGSEAFDMLAAMNTGHEGSLTTLHANSPRDALARLETLILMAGMDLPLSAVREHIAASIDLIVQQVRASNGHRFISSIVEVAGMESGRIQTQTLFQYEEGSPGWFSGCGLVPELLSRGGNQALRRLDVELFNTRAVRVACPNGAASF